MGLQGLGSSGGFERLHYLLETAFDGPDLSMAFMKVSLGTFGSHCYCCNVSTESALRSHGATSLWWLKPTAGCGVLLYIDGRISYSQQKTDIQIMIAF